jgi:hypothetical protein
MEEMFEVRRRPTSLPRVIKLAGLIAVALVAAMPQARADVVYTWETLSATVDGVPTSLTASGQIALTDAGFASGSVSVTTDPFLPLDQTLDGVVSASFGMFGGPVVSTSDSNSIVNFTASVNGNFLDVTPDNLFFFSTYPTTEQYSGESGPGPHVLTIGFGTDNSASVCSGPAQPGQSHCVVTGFFQQVAVPEPGSLAILATAFAAFGGLRFARRRKKSSAKAV